MGTFIVTNTRIYFCRLKFSASNTGVSSAADIIPFAVNGFNHHKHRVLLTRLIQGNANQFPNGTLNEFEEVRNHDDSSKLY